MSRDPQPPAGDPPVLCTVGTRQQAESIRRRLEAAGIPCWMPDAGLDDVMPGLAGPLTGLRVRVRAGDLDRAREVLAAGAAPADPETGAEPEPAPEEETPRDVPWAFTLAFLTGGGLLVFLALPYRRFPPGPGLPRLLSSTAAWVLIFLLGGVMGIVVHLIRGHWLRTRARRPGEDADNPDAGDRDRPDP